MTLRWISQQSRNRRLTIHRASCYMCNEGRGCKYLLIGRSPTNARSHQWHGPFSTITDAHAAAELLATPGRTTVRECRHCEQNPSQTVSAADNGDITPSGAQAVMPMPEQEVTYTELWILVRGVRPRATIHVSFCGIDYHDERHQRLKHGTNVTTPTVQPGWYGPFPSLTDADRAARHLQQNPGMVVRDCLRCARGLRLHPLNSEIAPGYPSVRGADDIAVPIDRSVSRDYITCLECGQRTQLLAIHLRWAHEITPNEYRSKWDLPDTSPMRSLSHQTRHTRLYLAENVEQDQPIDKR
jgi:ROS/MUCR transcriptional regulator protein